MCRKVRRGKIDTCRERVHNHDKWQKISDDDRERQAGIVDGKPVTVNEKKHHRAGFQFVYRTPATELMIKVGGPHSGDKVWRLNISSF